MLWYKNDIPDTRGLLQTGEKLYMGMGFFYFRNVLLLLLWQDSSLNVSFFLQMDNLSNLSPALLASVGVLMMNMTDVGWRLMLIQWLQQRPEEDREMLTGFCDTYIDKCVEYLSQCTQPHMFGSVSKGLPHYKRIIPHTIENMISTFGILLEVSNVSLEGRILNSSYNLFL